MPDQPRALFLIGSAKTTPSTSASLAGHLAARLEDRGWVTESRVIHRAHRSPERLQDLLEESDRCDLLVLAFPLFVDSLPALTIRTLEMIAERRKDRDDGRPRRLLAIVNCGFPEAEHNQVALRICRRFAAETGFEWSGGLGLGGGEAIGGRNLTSVKGMARNVIAALDLTAEAVAAGDPVPDRAVSLMAKPLIWSRLYTWVGGRGWKKRAAKHGVADRLDDRPY